jgi:hypothetical protein
MNLCVPDGGIEVTLRLKNDFSLKIVGNFTLLATRWRFPRFCENTWGGWVGDAPNGGIRKFVHTD